jgi:hypothetical protein
MSERRTREARPILRGLATPADPDAMRVLLAAGALGRLSAARVAAALARGLQQAGLAAPDLLELPGAPASGQLRELLAQERFDARLHRARCLIIAAPELSEAALPASAAFELATRARQGGVPAYAVAGVCEIDAFDARVLDLQRVLRARTEPALTAAGAALASLLRPG